jgi:hypothetical protein
MFEFLPRAVPQLLLYLRRSRAKIQVCNFAHNQDKNNAPHCELARKIQKLTASAIFSVIIFSIKFMVCLNIELEF